MKKLRIAVIAKRFPKIYETFVLNHIVGLINQGHDVDIFSLRKPYANEIHHQAVTRYGLLQKTHYLTRTNRSLMKCYDIIHCHFGTVGQRMAFLKNIYPDSKLFVTFHGYDVRLGIRKGGRIYRELFQFADGVIAVCAYNRKRLLELGCPKSKVIDLPNGVDLQKFVPAQRMHNGHLRITTVARMSKSKNIPFALEVIKAIKEEGKFDFQYSIVGDGKQRKNIEALIDRYGLRNHVVLHGLCTEDGVHEVLNRTDLLFLPSRDEAFPVCLLEAQAMQIPPVTTNVGGISEAVQDGRTGFLVPPNDVLMAKNRIDTLLENRILRESMGRQGKLWIEQHFDLQNLTMQLRKIYET